MKTNIVQNIAKTNEIIAAMRRLGIPVTEFYNMKVQAGGLEKLYNIMSRQIV